MTTKSPVVFWKTLEVGKSLDWIGGKCSGDWILDLSVHDFMTCSARRMRMHANDANDSYATQF